MTLLQVFPPSRVSCTRPSSVPTQISWSSRGDSAIVKMTPKPQGRAFSTVTAPAQPFAFGSAPERSGLALSQVSPESSERSRYCEPA